jgi:hypothetical protein
VSAAFTIDRALTDPRLLGAALGDPATWRTWLAVLKAAFALPLDEQQQTTFASVAGGRKPPTQRVRELWCVAARRSGKSKVSAAVAIYLALFVRHQLSRGERGMVLVIAGSIDLGAGGVRLRARIPRRGPGAAGRGRQRNAERDHTAQRRCDRGAQQFLPNREIKNACGRNFGRSKFLARRFVCFT